MLEMTLVWGSLCVVAVVAALAWPPAARRVLGVFFMVMALGVNVVYALVAPERLVGLGTDAPLLRLYEWAFETVVAAAPVAFGLFIAAYEVLVGILMLRGGRAGRWGLGGGVVFLVVSSPLGLWTLPNLLLAAALVIVLRREMPAVDGAVGPLVAPVASADDRPARPYVGMGN